MVVRVYDRYYTRFFAVDVKGNPGFDQFVYAHSNCTCVLGITRFHRLVTRGSPVVSLRFTLGKDGVEDVKVGAHLCAGAMGCFLIVCSVCVCVWGGGAEVCRDSRGRDAVKCGERAVFAT